jgi:hypothetical protein
MNKNNNFTKKILLIYLAAASLVGVAALILLVANPGEAEYIWILGLLKSRFSLAMGILLGVVIFVSVSFKTWHEAKWAARFKNLGHAIVHYQYIYYLLAILLPVTFIVGSQILYSSPLLDGYIENLGPKILWILALSLTTWLILPILRHGDSLQVFAPRARNLRLGFFVFLGLLFLWGITLLTGLGIHPDTIGWDDPGVPILAFQVGLALLAGVIFLVAKYALGGEIVRDKRLTTTLRSYSDLVIVIVLWFVAFWLWGTESLTPTYFSPQPVAPNFEYYPYSDAAGHDMTAQRLLVGAGFSGIARKPLYAVFLALLHGIAGQSYEQVMLLQVAVLAFLPVLIFLLGKKLHHAVSGVIAALILIIREWNAIVLSGDIGVSHAKLMMSDLPATLGVVLLTWMVVSWLDKPIKQRLLPLGIGGVLGLLLLVRPQMVVLVPAMILLVAIAFYRQLKWGLLNIGLIILGFGLALSPWLWRSHQLTGQLLLNDPNQQAFLTQLYSLDPRQDPVERLPAESDRDFSQRIDDTISQFVRTHPDTVIGFITSHFAHNEVSIVQSLPLSFWWSHNINSDYFILWETHGKRLWSECCSPQTYVQAVPLWNQSQGDFPKSAPFMVFSNLAVLAIGLTVAWVRRDLIGWIPLGVSLIYSLSTALGRYSGWRLILPADWAIFLYYAMGLGQITLWLFAFYRGRRSDQEDEIKDNMWQRISRVHCLPKYSWRSTVLLSIGLFSLGLLPLMLEAWIPPRYPSLPSQEDLMRIPALAFEDTKIDDWAAWVEENNAITLYGRALYPRFYFPDQGQPGKGHPAFAVRDYSRLGFYLVGPQSAHVIVPLENSPEFFPNAADALVIGCQADDFLDAVVIIVQDTIIQAPKLPLSCLSVPQ